MLARSVGERGGSFGGDDGHFIVYAGDASEVSTCCSGDWRATTERKGPKVNFPLRNRIPERERRKE
jgi:hypothetical protein